VLLSVENIMSIAFSAGSALKTWFASRWFAPRRRQRQAVKKSRFYRLPLRLEQLEDRVTPSILGTFELDGNAQTGVLGTSGSTTPSHDWDQVFADNSVNPATNTAGALASTFVTDKVNSTADDIFTGGGSKDTNGIQEGPWLFTGSKPQGKNDITHAYAAAYTDPSNGHLILYAGLDRFDNSGDSTAGFWFFANNIGENPNVTTNGGHPFTGTHADGDILLVSDFTQGGSVSTIKVFRWTGNDSTGSLVAITAPAGTTFAIVNGAPISVPWSYTNKSGANQPAAGEFLEEGVDLTALGLQGCFSSFLAETRSSQSPTATVSDFVTGTFTLCTLAATPFNGVSKFDVARNQGDPVTYALTVTNTGGMPLFIQSVSDTLLGNVVVNHALQQPGAAGVNPFVTAISAGTYDFTQPLAVGASLTINVTRTVQQTDPDPTVSTTTFIGTDDLAGQEDPVTASATSTVNLFQPSATMTETASPAAGVVGTPITYTFTVTNTSSADSPNLVLDLSNPNDSFTDSLLGNLEADAIHAATGNNAATVARIAPGASFTFTEKRAIQAGDPTPLTDSASAGFTLAQNLGSFPNVIPASAGATVRLVNAEISIAGSGVNEVNNPHTFVVTVKEDLGDGKGFVPVPAGVPVTVTLTNANDSTTSPTTYNLTTDGSGHASVTFTSATAGQVIGNASTSFVLNGVTLTRATGDSHVGDSGPATKFFEDAKISITPSATNEVGQPHTFTVTVLQDDGVAAGAPGGDAFNGFGPAANRTVTLTLANQNRAQASPGGPFTLTIDGSGHASVTFTSATAGQVIGNASTTFVLNGVTLTRQTGDGQSGDSGPATKTFEDAHITIGPNGVNLVGQPHTFTVTVTENAGGGAGFVPAEGVPVTVTLTNTNGSSTSPTTFSGTADASGHFLVTFTSPTGGEVIGNATTTFVLNGVTLTRATGDSHAGDSGPAEKFFGSIATTPGPAVALGSGAALNDSATLSGANPTGTITFQLFAPDGTTVVYTDVFTLTGAPAPVTVNTSMGDHPGGFVPTALGTYQWVVIYSGDAQNPKVSSPKGDEPETVVPASPTIVTTPGGTVTVGQGVPLADSATLAGGFNPTGVIVFQLFAPGGTTSVHTETVMVHGNGIYSTPTGFVPTVAGTYQWVATYSGDLNNHGAVSAFGSEPETAKAAAVTPVIISKQVFIGSNLGKSHHKVKKPHHKPRPHHKGTVRPHHR
jgi:hypothetical protein